MLFMIYDVLYLDPTISNLINLSALAACDVIDLSVCALVSVGVRQQFKNIAFIRVRST